LGRVEELRKTYSVDWLLSRLAGELDALEDKDRGHEVDWRCRPGSRHTVVQVA
jgi:hypothetical protein